MFKEKVIYGHMLGFFLWAPLGAGAPAECFGRSAPSRPICCATPSDSSSSAIFFTLSSSPRALAVPTARRGRPTLRHSARPGRSPPPPPVGADRSPPRPPVGAPWMQLCDSTRPSPLAAPAARRGRPALRDSARPDRSLPPLLVGVPWMQLRLTDDWFQQKTEMPRGSIFPCQS